VPRRGVVAERADTGLVVTLGAQQLPDPVHHMDKALPVGQVRTQQEAATAVPAVAGGDLEHAGSAGHADSAPVSSTIDCLDTRHHAGGEERAYRVPVVSRHCRQPQCEPAVGGEPVGAAPPVPQVGGRLAEHLPHRAVELAQAAEAGREGDVQDGEVGVVEQPASEMRSPGPGQLIGGHTEMRAEQPPQVPRGQADPVR